MTFPHAHPRVTRDSGCLGGDGGSRLSGKNTGSVDGLNLVPSCLARAVLVLGPTQVSGFPTLHTSGVMEKYLKSV